MPENVSPERRQMLGDLGHLVLQAGAHVVQLRRLRPQVRRTVAQQDQPVLLKQARAFGLGILLATQNPADLDYKALANIGTWWLGPDSRTAKLADMVKIVSPCCTARTSLVENDRPSRGRSTRYTMGSPVRPGRRK